MTKFLKKEAHSGAVDPIQVVPDALGDAHPAIVEFITAGRWDDGSERTTGTLLICWGDGKFKAWLNDRDGAKSTWVSADTLEALLGGLEARLQAGSLEWRATQVGRKGFHRGRA